MKYRVDKPIADILDTLVKVALDFGVRLIVGSEYIR